MVCFICASVTVSDSIRCEKMSGRTLYRLFSLCDRFIKNVLHIPLSSGSSSFRHVTISDIWLWARIISRRIKFDKVKNVAFLMQSNGSFSLKFVCVITIEIFEHFGNTFDIFLASMVRLYSGTLLINQKGEPELNT